MDISFPNSKTVDELKSGGPKVQQEIHEPTVIGRLNSVLLVLALLLCLPLCLLWSLLVFLFMYQLTGCKRPTLTKKDFFYSM